MEKIQFSVEEKAALIHKIKRYFIHELDSEIGQFDAEFLLEFFGEEIGGYYYNQGLRDATVLLESGIDGIKEALYTMEEPLS